MLKNRNRGFTLIELLVVVAIIGLLIGLLVPALGRARNVAQQAVITNNLRQVTIAVQGYVVDNEYFPPSYVYADSLTGFDWDLEDQLNSNPEASNGYVHWSYAIFEGKETADAAFESPIVEDGGAPRSNPGEDDTAWSDGQINELGQSAPGSEFPEDRQVKRIAYTGNAAIFPRNKFNENAGNAALPTQQLVRSGRVNDADSRLILATEFQDSPGWRTLVGNSGFIRSHRPVTPFVTSAGDVDPYNALLRGGIPRYRYAEPEVDSNGSAEDRGGQSVEFVRSAEAIERILQERPEISLINDSSTTQSLNAVGRLHDDGKTHFVFLDGHVEKLDLHETIQRELWGSKFYSIQGGSGRETEVLGYDEQYDF